MKYDKIYLTTEQIDLLTSLKGNTQCKLILRKNNEVKIVRASRTIPTKYIFNIDGNTYKLKDKQLFKI